MDIKQLSIDYCTKSGIISDVADHYKHVKALPWLSIMQVCKGSGTLTVGESDTFSVKEGGVFIIPSKRIHTLDIRGTDGIYCRWVNLDPRINAKYPFDECYKVPITVEDARAERLVRSIDGLFASGDLFADYSYYYDILRVVFTVSVPCEAVEEIPLIRALQYIEKHYDSKVAVNDLAEMSNLSLSRFYAVFSEVYGTSPISYINNYRLALASELLISSELSISDIATEVGILDPIYFNKMFKRAYSSSPSAFRKLYRKI